MIYSYIYRQGDPESVEGDQGGGGGEESRSQWRVAREAHSLEGYGVAKCFLCTGVGAFKQLQFDNPCNQSAIIR